MLVTLLGKNFGTQFPLQFFRYPLAFNTCDKSGYNEPILHQTLNLMSCGLPRFSPEPFNFIAIPPQELNGRELPLGKICYLLLPLLVDMVEVFCVCSFKKVNLTFKVALITPDNTQVSLLIEDTYFRNGSYESFVSQTCRLRQFFYLTLTYQAFLLV